MINPDQTAYLLSLVEPNRVVYDMGLPVSVHYPKKNEIIKVNYEEFKTCMSLDDIPLHWLTSYNIHMAGGAVMNWVWQENTNNDIDFFFANEGAFFAFSSLISSYGFKEVDTCRKGYGGMSEVPPFKKLNNSAEGLMLHLIGGDEWRISKGAYDSITVTPYGDPVSNIRRFDLRVCQFAVDCENIYMSRFGILDLLTKRLVRNFEAKRNSGRFQNRIKKYKEKGFGQSIINNKSTAYMDTAKVGPYAGRIVGKLEQSDYNVILVTHVPFLSSKPHKRFGFPIRQNKLEWGAYYGSDNEVITKV